MGTRYLTKSRFKLGLECPTKVYYDGKPDYANQKLEDSFLLSLAEGGFQVGELAKRYWPGGYEIDTLDYEIAISRTNELLKLDEVIIYEAAFRYENYFIRVDILHKVHNKLELIEVKAKSYDPEKDQGFVGSKGKIKSAWEPYLYDASFQKYVLSHAMPDSSVSAFLMLVNKKAECETDGLNQKFRIVTDAYGRKRVIVSGSLCDNISDHFIP